ncbi:MAG: hypothetical protein U0325_32735 [Polyangiales bacterium]
MPGALSGVVDCIASNAAVCERGLAQPPEACRGVLSAFQPCAMSLAGDAGTTPTPAPLDAGGPDV